MWWLVLTAVYIGVQFAGLAPLVIIGLFVPIGILNSIVMLGAPVLGILSVLLLLITLYFADSWAVKLNIRSSGLKILFNLGLLLLVTLVIDLILFQTWQSLALVTGVGGADLGF